jgi:hypothetical protein
MDVTAVAPDDLSLLNLIFQDEKAAKFFNASFQDNMHAPFHVWTEVVRVFRLVLQRRIKCISCSRTEELSTSSQVPADFCRHSLWATRVFA